MKPQLNCQQQLENLKKEYEEFVYIVSHDLKAPLRAISNLSGWIKEDLGDQLDADVQHNLDLLQNRTERMERMINGLLILSRVTRHELEIREVNVQELVLQLVAALQQKHSFEIHLPTLPTFITYAKKLEVVFSSLLQNAVTYNEQPTPEIWIEMEEQEEAYLFTVKDNGIGIPEDVSEKIFKMFYSVQSKDQQESTGIGLSITRKILEFVGGSISFNSALGQGSQFSFSWPKTIKEDF